VFSFSNLKVAIAAGGSFSTNIVTSIFYAFVLLAAIVSNLIAISVMVCPLCQRGSLVGLCFVLSSILTFLLLVRYVCGHMTQFMILTFEPNSCKF
jgi:hypothetical protein